MPLINTTLYADGLQNFLAPENNTNSYDNDLIQNSATISEEGIASGFHIAQTTSPSNQVQIRFSPSQTSKNGKVGTVVVKTPSNEFLVLALRSATALNLDVPENTTAFTRYDLICVYADFRTTGTTNFSIKYFSNENLTDPDLDAWNAANTGQFLLPIARIAKTPGSLVDSSQIILSGQTTYNVDKSVRQTVKYLAGTIKVMTEAERNASAWNSGDLCLVKAPLDVNNTLHINTSTTATPLWRQIVLLAQSLNRWALLAAQSIGNSSGTFTILENMGTPTGGFTLPAGFFAVNMVLSFRFQNLISSSHHYGTAPGFVLHQRLIHAVAINGLSVFSHFLDRSSTISQLSFQYNDTVSLAADIIVQEITSNNIRLLVRCEEKVSSGFLGVPISYTTILRETTVNLPVSNTGYAISPVFTKSIGTVTVTANQITSYTVSVQS
jgi:hypothetical protein